MFGQSFIVYLLTFLIYVIATLSYSVRVVGIRTGRIAIAFSVFNILVLISRMAGTFQAPLLAKTIDNAIITGTSDHLLPLFRYVLLSATVATMVGAFLIPSFIKIFSKAVESFSIYRSIPRLLLHGFSKSGISQFKKILTIPSRISLTTLTNVRKIPKRIVLLNFIVFSISSVGTLASLYAGSLNPELRTTCNSLSPLINGVATILLYIFIDPYISMLTDDVIHGKCPLEQFHRSIAYIVAGLIAGTMAAQLLLEPAAEIISYVAKII